MWSMFAVSLLENDSDLRSWHQSYPQFPGVIHDGEFIVLIHSPDESIPIDRVMLDGDSIEENLAIGGAFLSDHQGRILQGQDEVFRAIYCSAQYQARIERLNPTAT